MSKTLDYTNSTQRARTIRQGLTLVIGVFAALLLTVIGVGWGALNSATTACRTCSGHRRR
ncbi:Tar ligand binding domain homologue [Paraburkholderia hospita]|nr:Tar ligand binding domain homologue [Paraburkholderia hospita]